MESVGCLAQHSPGDWRMTRITAATDLGCRGCHHCQLVFSVASAADDAICPRCGEPTHHRKPNSIQRTLALLITAVLLYIPANLLPVFRTISLGDGQDHTIVGGVVDLANSGSWELALIVFVASVVVPVFKIFALFILVWFSHGRRTTQAQQHAALFRVVEAIGHWSMLDIFVIALLVALVQFGSIATIEPANGAIAFGLVVVLTMLASMSFDPRLMWDKKGKESDNVDAPKRSAL